MTQINKRTKLAAVGAAALLAVTLSACGGSSAQNDSSPSPATEAPIGGDVIAPVTTSVNELQGAEVELVVGQVLNIMTDSLAVDSYTGQVVNARVAEFTAGRVDGSAEFNPGVTALAVGTTKVTMTNDQGGIQPLEFTVKVVAK